ncbi:MAG: P-loop NTPase [Smithellaceae bacterium]|jgi:MinD superfamily P-loop ATPase|nr:P-loop NTPase [Smithellaceae bacterium]
MRISVASGKGGTGKTTVSFNLARTMGVPVQLLDCDVEEPNAHLFLTGSGDDRVHSYCEKKGITILPVIPDDRKIAESYSRGFLMVGSLPKYRNLFQGLIPKLTTFEKKRSF